MTDESLAPIKVKLNTNTREYIFDERRLTKFVDLLHTRMNEVETWVLKRHPSGVTKFFMQDFANRAVKEYVRVQGRICLGMDNTQQATDYKKPLITWGKDKKYTKELINNPNASKKN